MINNIYIAVILLGSLVFRVEAKTDIRNEVGRTCLESLSTIMSVNEFKIDSVNKVEEHFHLKSKIGKVNSIEFGRKNVLDIISIIFPDVDQSTLHLERIPVGNILKNQNATGTVGSGDENYFFEHSLIGCEKHIPMNVTNLYLSLFQQEYNPLTFFLIPIEIQRLFREATQIEIRKNTTNTLFLFAGINDYESYGYIFVIEIIGDKTLNSFVIYKKGLALVALEDNLEKIDKLVESGSL